MKARFALGVMVTLALGTYACDRPARPLFPEDAVPMEPPGRYALWWEVAQACSEITTPIPSVNWYMVPRVNEFSVGEERAAGLWWADSNRIVVAEGFLNDGHLVRHEMLHALGQFGGHPPLYFRDRCGGIVSCGGHECLKEAGPLLTPPPTALRVNPGDMQVAVAVAPTTYLKTNGGWVVVTVSVTNPRSIPVWVKLTPLGTSTSAQTFGFTLGTFNGTETTSGELLSFAAGETKRASFDVQLGVLGGVSAGSYPVRGIFNGDTTLAVFLTVP